MFEAPALANGGASDFIGSGIGDMKDENDGMTDLEKEMMGIGGDSGNG